MARPSPKPRARAQGAIFALAVAGWAAGCGPQVRNTQTAKLEGSLLSDARRADALGLTPTAALSTLPARTGDLARALGEGGPEKPPPGEDPPLTPSQSWFVAVKDRYQLSIEDALVEPEGPATFFEPLEDPRFRYLFVDGPVKFYNEGGRDIREGSNLYASNRAVARVAERLVVTADPELRYEEHRDSDDDSGLRFRELSASGRLGPAELTVGRSPLWWGPGRHGALLLSNNAQPFDLVKLSTAGPQLLPWIFSYLGLVQGELFFTRLEGARQVRHPYLAGARISSRLNPYLELGASRTAMFGGEGRPVTARTIGHVITARTENDVDDPGDQLASLDARIIVPWRFQPFEIYGEVGGEDEASGFFSKEAYLVGLYLPRIGPSQLFELNVELANTTVRGTPGVWYRNGNFPDGYTYHGEIIGHHVGTDGLDFFTELRLHPTERLTVFVSHDYEEHQRQDTVEERLNQVRAGVEARVWGGLWLSAFSGLDYWKNLRQVRGDDEIGYVLGAGARWKF